MKEDIEHVGDRSDAELRGIHCALCHHGRRPTLLLPYRSAAARGFARCRSIAGRVCPNSLARSWKTAGGFTLPNYLQFVEKSYEVVSHYPNARLQDATAELVHLFTRAIREGPPARE